MTTYLLLYRSEQSPAERMADATPEQAEAGMQAWMAWAGKVGDALVDLGSPVTAAGSVGAGPGGGLHIGGFSMMEAASVDELRGLLDGHPHLQSDTDGIEILEYLPVPGT